MCDSKDDCGDGSDETYCGKCSHTCQLLCDEIGGAGSTIKKTRHAHTRFTYGVPTSHTPRTAARFRLFSCWNTIPNNIDIVLQISFSVCFLTFSRIFVPSLL